MNINLFDTNFNSEDYKKMFKTQFDKEKELFGGSSDLSSNSDSEILESENEEITDYQIGSSKKKDSSNIKSSESEPKDSSNIKSSESEPKDSSNTTEFHISKNEKFDTNSKIPTIKEMNYINSLDSSTYDTGYFEPSKEHEINNSIQESKLLVNSNIINALLPYYNVEEQKKDNYNLPITKKNNFDILAELGNNQYDSFLLYKTSKAQEVTNNINYIDKINRFIKLPYKNSLSVFFNKFGKFIEIFNFLSNHLIYDDEHNISKSSKSLTEIIESVNKKLNSKYKVNQLPKEITIYIKHIETFFDRIKKFLTLNSSTGYYEITYHGQNIPILCKHLYMTFSKESLWKISEECSIRGNCKYCGDNLAGNTFEDTTLLPSQISEICFKILEAYSQEGSDTNIIFLYLYNNIANLIPKFVSSEDEQFEDKSIGIASLFAYALIKHSPPEIDYHKLLKMISANCAVLGWNEERIEELLNSNLFGDLDGILTLIKSGIKQDGKSDLEDVFLNFVPKELENIRKHDKLNEFNEKFKQDYFTNMHTDLIIETKKIKFNSELQNFQQTRFNTIDIFENFIKTNCPERGIHEIKNNICKFCGYDIKKNNLEEIYLKYNTQFNTGVDLEPTYNVSKIKVQNNKDLIKDILKEDKQKTFKYITEKLNINETRWKEYYSTLDEMNYELIICLKSRFNINDDSFDSLTKDDILKLIKYLSEKLKDDSLMNMYDIRNNKFYGYVKTRRRNGEDVY